jgi:hypothetical protein
MAKEAVTKALKDAGLLIADIQQACVGYVYGMYFLVSLLSSSCTSQLERPLLSISRLYRLTPDHDFPHCKAVILYVCLVVVVVVWGP